jgi:Zn-finger nucleic acid-binding protein
MPHCPLCKTLCDPLTYEGVRIYNCGGCGGNWIDQLKLDLILARREVVMPEPVKQKMMDIADAADSKQELWCLSCGTAMVKEQFKFWPEIQLDRCPKCERLWLDRGELEKCQIFWEYMQDHPEQWSNPALAQRLAELDAQWALRKARLRSVKEEIEAGPPLQNLLRSEAPTEPSHNEVGGWLGLMLAKLGRAAP